MTLFPPHERRPMSDQERLAILETQMLHLAQSIGEHNRQVDAVSRDVAEIKKALTTAAGVKLALITIGAAVSFAVTQFWHILDLKGFK